jgi:diaphanous 1
VPRRKLSDTEELVLLEVVKCLRVLLNTAPGYPYVIETPTIVTHIAFTLHGASPKLRALSSDLLAAICVISLNEGHHLVLGALSDYKICFGEAFRFEELVDALRIEENPESREGEDDGSWEARGATMGLIIALTSCSDSIEDRILLREEFSRRGLNEVMVVSAHPLHRLYSSNGNMDRGYGILNHPMLCSSSSTPTPRTNMKTKMICGISCVV